MVVNIGDSHTSVWKAWSRAWGWVCISVLSTGSIGVGGAAGGRRSDGGGSRLLDSLKANVDGQCSESKPVSREVAACCMLYPQGPAVVWEEGIAQEGGSSH